MPYLLLAFAPVAALLYGAFHPGGGGWSLSAIEGALLDSHRLELLGNSLQLGAGVVLGTLILGLPYGFLVARSDLVGRAVYRALAVVPLLIPPYIAGIAWTEVVSIGGRSAMVLLLSLTLFPIVALWSAHAFAQVDRDVEDAARLAVGDRRALRRVTLCLARPSILAACLLVFLFAVSDFSVPDFFSFAGLQSGSFQVFATDIYFRWATQTDPEAATAAAFPLVVLALGCMALVARLESRRSHRSMGGSFRPPRAFSLGRWQPLAHVHLLLTLGASVGVPVGVMLRWAFFDPRSVLIDPKGADTIVTGPLDPLELLRGPAGGDLLRSLGYAGAAAAGMLLLALLLSSRLARGRSTLALACVLLPLGFPSLLISMAEVQLFNHPGSLFDAFYTGGGLVVLTLMARFLPVAVLGLRAAWLRLHPEMDEAARLSIPSFPRRLLRIHLPLLASGLAATFVLCFALSMRELDVIVLLDGAQKTLPLRIYNKVHYARDAEVAILCLVQLAVILIPWAIVHLLLPRRESR